MQISIASYSFHGFRAAGMMDVFGYLETCKYRYHLDTADIWNGLLGSDPDQYLQRDFLQKVKNAMDERGLMLVNYHADGCHIWEDSAETREKHYDLAMRHIEAAEFLGARTVRIDSGGREAKWSAQQFDEIVRVYREWAKRAASNGYRIGPETHWGAELHPDEMHRLAKAVDHPGFGILMHVGRWSEGDPDANDARLAPYTCHAHIDAKTAATRIDTALRILSDTGYQGCLGIEHGRAQDEYADVALIIAQVRRALAARRASAPQKTQGGNPLLAPGTQR
jgi:sugar phosphate isomerase/epimerase